VRLRLPAVLLLGCLAAAQSAPLILVVKTYLANGDPGVAQKVLAQYRSARGTTPEYIEALSWVGRAELASRDYTGAEQNAEEVRKLSLAQLTRRKLDAEPSLPMALGASIETQAQLAAIQGRRDEAVTFLKAELVKWSGTSIVPRIRKNLNLLTLEGKPAPALEGASLTRYRGHPTLLFFWAHWCSDCKAEIAIIAALQKTYGPKGLAVIAPTQHYGYVAGGQDAPRDVETAYIRKIYAQYYSALGQIEVPVSEANFNSYGVSTTPTLTLIDSRGIVRLYNPGNLTYDQLAARIQPLLSR
jgi:thiol-disulfide isomerase/thioredoxin